MDETTIIGYFRGEISEEDCLRVEEWSEASPENRKTLEQLYYILFVGDRINAMQEVDTEASLAKLKSEIKRKESKNKKSNRGWKRFSIAAAAFLAGIICMGSIFWTLSERKSDYVFSTEAGERAQVTLPDGSKVWLNSSTQLSYHSSFFNLDRKMDLKGEAYFEVTKDKHRPFIVNSNNVRTCVLGTKFNIRARAEEERVITTLLEGSVRVDAPLDDEKGITLKPGQSLLVNTSTYSSTIINDPKHDDVLLWIEGKLNFKNTTLLEIANQLEKHFDIQFEFDNNALKEKQFTCEFDTDEDITQILTILSLTKRMSYQKDGRKVKLLD